MEFRSKLKATDIDAVSEILRSTGFFYNHEIAIAMELVNENLTKGGEKSGYIFNIAEINNQPCAFSCYGKIPCTDDSFDLYWVAVHKSQQSKGTGKTLMDMAVKDIARMSGKYIWADTSSRPLYESTRKFYLKSGFEKIAELPNFYGANDNKIIFLKKLQK
ncbi:GNAT family N-acetyltransferase [bacterium]|nr:GNAT family N-acetyltransferase [bacterium]MBU3929671.1 GNAT family N-acetyltransferase [bacterium]MBU4122628.1 GNAT family N-acetyltransferase [bacterium]